MRMRVLRENLRVEIENEMRVFLESLKFEIKMRVSQKSVWTEWDRLFLLIFFDKHFWFCPRLLVPEL